MNKIVIVSITNPLNFDEYILPFINLKDAYTYVIEYFKEFFPGYDYLLFTSVAEEYINRVVGDKELPEVGEFKRFYEVMESVE